MCFYANIGIDFSDVGFMRWMVLPPHLSKFAVAKADTGLHIDDLIPESRLD